ncbi:DNA primase family protein [Allorhizobium taibaishanense]|uniref:DNA primase n=1 Tax=Allorhizobium taibaishanense TaxID=887144 RepID=A0A1Q9A318_9HYPH|nr:DNA primase family protein [Allorhizobium taibaishanense]MBB4005819.1 putative DNA primase/helicase [Allorhizobium taibaishanense]OLP48868.1 DNA primase [Allorhizobium taibaishanense]
MTDPKKPDLPQEVHQILQMAAAQRQGYAPNPETPEDPLGDAPAALAGDSDPDDAVVEFCAELDHSDTDNATRLRLHFGDDMTVIAQEKAKTPLYAVWTGSHWDVANGKPKAMAIAQRLGSRIAAEIKYIKPNEFEQFLIDSAKDALAKKESERDAEERKLVSAAQAASESHGKRVAKRLNHAVTSKNVARLNAMLECLSPHIMKSPDDFNADKWMVAVKNATLRFERTMTRKKNARHKSVEETPDAPEYLQVCTDAKLVVIPGHRRKDLITHVVPVRYDPKAKCPQWDAFLNSKLPDESVRRLVQVSSGLSLLGVSVQYLFFHYGNGANGKSVYMETLCRIIGDASVTLPSSSLIGEGGSSGSASPDVARLYGKRLLRVKELPEGEDLRENLVKELTGGETVTARDLFSGYMDFQPLFIAMMSGNGYPKISGTDDGIWRRMAVVHWPRQIAVEDRRDFEEVVQSFVPEHSGILNWLIEGVFIYLREGLVIPEAVKVATQQYRDDMDRTAAFVARCVVKNESADPVEGKVLYQAYCDFTIDQGGKPMNVTAFGREMGKKFAKDRTSGIVLYRGISLANVPDVPQSGPPARYHEEPFPSGPESYGGPF